MKKTILILLSLSVLLVSCKEDYIGQYPTDNIAPDAVSNVRVDNQPGKSIIHYTLPDVTDIMGVKAKYYFPGTGEYKEMFSSAYVNSLTLSGFGKSSPVEVELVAVDNSYNESEPVTVSIQPEDSPIYLVLNSISATESFGGFILKWDNAMKEDVIIDMSRPGKDGKYESIDKIYSSSASGSVAVHEQDDVLTKFGFTCSDSYGNTTDTLFIELTPIFEEKLDKDLFKALPLNSSFPYNSYGGKSITKIWDKTYNVDDNLLYLNNNTTSPIYFSFDTGVTSKICRFKTWGRVDYLFALHHFRVFEVWGTTDATAANDAYSFDGWNLIMTCESFRPSGETKGVTKSTDLPLVDLEYGKGGEEWMFPEDAPEVRYLRIVVLQTWTDSNKAFIGEIDIWRTLSEMDK